MSLFYQFPLTLNLFLSGFGLHCTFLPMSADVFDQPLTSPFSSIRHWPWSLLKTLLARASMVPCSFGFLPSSWAVFLLFFASLFVCFHISLVVLNSIKYQSSLTLGPKPSTFLFLYILVLQSCLLSWLWWSPVCRWNPQIHIPFI